MILHSDKTINPQGRHNNLKYLLLNNQFKTNKAKNKKADRCMEKSKIIFDFNISSPISNWYSSYRENNQECRFEHNKYTEYSIQWWQNTYFFILPMEHSVRGIISSALKQTSANLKEIQSHSTLSGDKGSN